MNAVEVAIAKATANGYGLTPNVSAMVMATGARSTVAAALDMTCVRRVATQ